MPFFFDWSTVDNPTGLFLPVILVVAFYFLFIKPNKARRKQFTEMQSSVVPGVRVMTTSGIYGVVTAVNEASVSVEIAPGVVIELVTAAIGRVIVPQSAEGAQPITDAQEGEL
ncbi:MAG: preprotein translocase subunit YajC [Actinobacteria bacterium]|nr:preprotein translocase subunit YajC [Actinomycetota bacterium]